MSDNRPCEVYDIGITAFRQFFPDKETNVGDYWIATTFGRFGFVCPDVSVFWNDECLFALIERVGWSYDCNLYYLKEGVLSYGQDYEIWHVVEDNPSCLEGEEEDYPYWVALCEVDETDEGEPCWVPAEFVSFRTESEAQMFAERVCGYPFMLTEVGYFYPTGRLLLHRYKCIVTPSGRKLVKRGW